MRNTTSALLIILSLAIQLNVRAQNTAYAVGTIPGAADVTATGAATYTIPIEVVPGTRGVQPNLSITYNSQSGMGALGMKWHLSGLSAISRVPLTRYHDGEVRLPRFDTLDRFSWDGEILIRAGELYYTEMENHSSVERKNDNHGDYFVATLDGGTRITYGRSPQSKVLVGGREYCWLADTLSDMHGNYMAFHYGQDGGEAWPVRIEYTGNLPGNKACYARVEFSHIDDPAGGNAGFVMGEQVGRSKLLKEIRVYYGNSLARRYALNYDLGRTAHLREVVLHGSDGTRLNSTTAQWGAQNENATVARLALPRNGSACLGDFNGDGYTDVVSHDRAARKWTLCLNNTDGTCSPRGNGDLIGAAQPTLRAGDFNGDGKDELLIVDRLSTGGSAHYTKTVTFDDFGGVASVAQGKNMSGNGVLLGDFNGDGKCDVVTVQPGTNKLVLEGLNVELSHAVPAGSTFHVLDFDQDEKAEIQVTCGATTTTYKYAEEEKTLRPLYADQFPQSNHVTHHGDFNGDGITDILFYIGKKTARWHIVFGNGHNQYSWPPQELPEEMLYCAKDLNFDDKPLISVLIADVDGDGKDDIVQPFFNYNTQRATLRVFKSKGLVNNRHTYSTSTHTDPLLTSDNVAAHYQLGDFNGDGKTDVYFRQSVTQDAVIVHFNKDEQFELVQSVTDGFGNATRFTYRPQYLRASFFTPGTVKRRRQFTHLAEAMRAPSGSGGEFREYRFSFAGPVFGFNRGRFLGFATVKKVDGSVSATTVSNFHSAKEILLPSREQVQIEHRQIATTYTHGFKELPHGRFFHWVSEQATDDGTRASRTAVITSVTDDCRTGSVQKDVYPAGSATPLVTETASYEYAEVRLPNGAAQKRVGSAASSIKLNGAANGIGSLTVYEYENGMLKSRSAHSTDHGVTTTYGQRDPFGNATRVTVAPQGSPPRTESMEFDATGRFAVRTTDPLGNNSQYLRDPATGNLLWCMSPDGLPTTFQYDAFGRETLRQHPDGTQTATRLAWNDVPDRVPATYMVTVSSTGLADARTYHDRLGREVCRHDGNGYASTRYDALGRVERRSLPHPAYTPPEDENLWALYTYDHLDRVTSERSAQCSLSHDHSAVNRTTTTDHLRGATSVTQYDAAGRLVSSSDPGGTVTHSYGMVSLAGKLRFSQTTTLHGHATTVVTDGEGNRLLLDEPNAGAITSQYDGYGQLAAQTDANGNTTTYEYDALGRVTRETASHPSGGTLATTYEYDHFTSSDNGRGKLYRVKVNGETKNTYNYDRLGRLAAESRHIAENNLVHQYVQSYTYNANGQVEEIAYPDNFAIKHIYDDGGNLLEIRRKDDNSLIYRKVRRNHFNQVTEFSLGNGLATRRLHNAYGQLEKIVTGKRITVSVNPPVLPPPGGGIGRLTSTFSTTSLPIADGIDSSCQHLAYAYDPRGMMTLRENRRNGQRETFTYDNLDRLTRSQINGRYSQRLLYDPDGKGNITHNSSVGDLLYEGPRPHAVTSARLLASNRLPQEDCAVTYNHFHQPTAISEGDRELRLHYGADRQRERTVYAQSGTTLKSKHFVSPLYEKELSAPNATRHLNYVYAETGLVAILVKTNIAQPGAIYYIHTDHLGSYDMVTDAGGKRVDSLHFDPWGNRIKYGDWSQKESRASFLFDRGFTGHEHLDAFRIINMNGRLYDPVIGRFFSPDQYVANIAFSQDFNRYSYCRNNPLMYTDPTGEIAWFVPVVIGAAIGTYSGGVMANNGEYNPAKWDYSSGRTWGYMLGGAVVGGASGYWGAAVAAGGGFMANTAGIVVGSFANSVGTFAYTGGQTPVSVAFGAFSYDFTNNEWGYLGKKGNKWYENVGYSLGALANLSDILAGFDPGEVTLRTENDPNYYKAVDADGNPIYRKDLIGHSQLLNSKGEPLIDWGPAPGTGGVSGFRDWVIGTNSYERGLPIPASKMKWSPIAIKGANLKTINWYNGILNKGGKYNLALNSCVSQTSRALNLSGIFNIGIHPYLLHAQMHLWSNGIRPWTFNYFLNQ